MNEECFKGGHDFLGGQIVKTYTQHTSFYNLLHMTRITQWKTIQETHLPATVCLAHDSV